MMHRTQPPPSIAIDRPDVPQALVDICSRMMAKSPEHRYQTAGEVANALNQWLGGQEKGPRRRAGLGESGRVPTLPRASPATPPPRRNRPGVLDDTVSDSNGATIKGSACSPILKPGDSDQFKNKLAVAKPLEEIPVADLDFLNKSSGRSSAGGAKRHARPRRDTSRRRGSR